MFKIAVDAMGGDNAPKAIVEGVLRALDEFEDLHCVLYGDEAEIKKYTTHHDRLSVVHASEKIESNDEPVKSIRTKKMSSLVLAAQAVKSKEVDALFSAGNTGALLAAGIFIVGRIKGIDRPGLMPTLPVFSQPDSKFLMLDVGANADSQPKHLEQFAVLGNYYAQKVFGLTNPRVALLNNGTEENKGNELTKAVYQLLEQKTDLNFIGNVEARELMNGVADVVVTDGFTGNAVLKSVEGTALSLIELIKQTIKSGDLKTKIGGVLVKQSLSGIKDVLDYSKHGGAVLFGLRAPVVKAHGSSDSVAVFHTLKQIRTILTSGVIEDVVHHFEEVVEERKEI